jgi:hypothetical protein
MATTKMAGSWRPQFTAWVVDGIGPQPADPGGRSNRGSGMVDKSWGGTSGVGFRVRTNDSPDERAAERAKARLLRAEQRAEILDQQLGARAASRESAVQAREQARVSRREREVAAAASAPHEAAAARHRSSGRRDVVREQRDTRSYTTVVDENRICELARRGASVAGLASAFGISQEEVARLLAGTADLAAGSPDTGE